VQAWAGLVTDQAQHQRVVAELVASCAEAPLREPLRGLLMLALYRGGRQAEALAEFESLSRVLNVEMGLRPGEELQALQMQILRADPGLDPPVAAAAEAASASGLVPSVSGVRSRPAGPVVVPAQLPHAASGFVGRGVELEELGRSLDAVDVDSAAIIAIEGSGGSGKTALAVHFAHRVSSQFGDGQLFVDLRGFDPVQPPVTAADALDYLLRGLGVAAQEIPVETGIRAGLYRSLVADKRILIVLDNALNSEQVSSLLPGSARAAVVVTSRNRLSGLAVRHGARRVGLGVLSESESLQVLSNAIGVERLLTEPAAATELTVLCGQLPLALRIAAEKVSARASAPISDFVAQLGQEQSRLDHLGFDDDELSTVRSVFFWSYRSLAPDSARAFRLLGLHPGTEISLPAAAALLAITPVAARGELDRLADQHLIDLIGPQRYRFHDLLRVYAAERALAEEPERHREQALERVLAWYVNTAIATRNQLMPSPTPPAKIGLTPPLPAEADFADTEQALTWTQAELANLTAAIGIAAAAGLDEHTWKLAWALQTYFVFRADPHQGIAVETLGLTATEHLHDVSNQARFHNNLSGLSRNAGDFTAALHHHRQTYALLQQLGDTEHQAYVLPGIATNLRELGRLDEALDVAHQALDLANQGLNLAPDYDPVNRCFALIELAQTMQARRDYPAAIAFGEQALAEGQQLDPPDHMLFAHGVLANIYRDTGDTTRAHTLHEQALQHSKQIGDRFSQAEVLRDMARTDQADGHLDTAIGHATQALTIYETINEYEAKRTRQLLTDLHTAQPTQSRTRVCP
jgi:tetratricopeptide (TPR) repeat protein